MQPIERYALVTLLFLVVLVMVVALWDDGSSAGAKPETDPKTGTVARLEDPGARQRQDTRRVSTPPRQVQESLPTSDRRAAAPGMRRVSTRPEGDVRHSIEPGRVEPGRAVAPTSFQPRKPRAQTPEQLEKMLTPNRRETVNSAPGGSFLGRPGATGSQALSSAVDSRARKSNSVERSKSSSNTSAPAFKPRPTNATRKPAAGEAAAPARKTPSDAKSRSYTIRSGDSLERIARRELPNAKTTAGVEAIARLNGLSKPYTIYAGDDLQIPASSTIAASGLRSPATQPAVSASGAASGGRPVYTIRSGEVLSNVLVARFGTYKRSLPIVLELNPSLDADHVLAGMKIVMPRADEIPGGTTKVAKTTAVKPSRRAAATNSEFVVR